METWAAAVASSARAPLWLVATSGAVAAILVAIGWVLTHAAVTVAHEGGHALIASAMGGKVTDINVYRGGGHTSVFLDGPGRLLAVGLAGYLGPPVFGVAGAILLSTGRVREVLWLSVFLLACAAYLAKGAYTVGSILLTGLVIFLVARYSSDGLRTFFAYTWIWFLLIGGIRSVTDLSNFRSLRKDTSSDAFRLRELTGVAAAIWVGFFGLVSFAALTAGGLIMVGILASDSGTPSP